jgi:hypothetical protein
MAEALGRASSPSFRDSPGGVLQPAKLVRLGVGAIGHDLAAIAAEEKR